MTPALSIFCEFLLKNWKNSHFWFLEIFHNESKMPEILLRIHFFDNPFSRTPYFYLINSQIKGFVIICTIASSKSGRSSVILEKISKNPKNFPKKHDFPQLLYLQLSWLWLPKGTQNVRKDHILQVPTPQSSQLERIFQNLRIFQVKITHFSHFQILPSFRSTSVKP